MTDLSDATLYRLLDLMPVARLAVRDANDDPDAMPIVFARVGDTLFSPIDGKPKKSPRLARLEHIRGHPRVTLVLDHYEADWSRLWWLRFEADAAVVHEDHAQWPEAVAALRGKYPQYDDTPLFSGPPTMIALVRRSVRWWAAEGMAGIERWLAGHA